MLVGMTCDGVNWSKGLAVSGTKIGEERWIATQHTKPDQYLLMLLTVHSIVFIELLCLSADVHS